MKKKKKIKKDKYRYLEYFVDGKAIDLRVYPCQHHKPDYKAVLALQEKTAEVLKKRDKDVEDLQVKLGECVEQLVLNNHYHEERTARYAKLYIGFKRKYQGLYKMRELYEREDEKNPFTEEEKAAAKDFEFKHKNVKLESGKIVDKYFLKKKHTKH